MHEREAGSGLSFRGKKKRKIFLEREQLVGLVEERKRKVFFAERRTRAAAFFLGEGCRKERERREQLKKKKLRSCWQRPPVVSGKSFSFFVKFSKLGNSMSSFVGFDC